MFEPPPSYGKPTEKQRFWKGQEMRSFLKSGVENFFERNCEKKTSAKKDSSQEMVRTNQMRKEYDGEIDKCQEQGSLYCQPKQCTITREIPLNYHKFALFDSPRMGTI